MAPNNNQSSIISIIYWSQRYDIISLMNWTIQNNLKKIISHFLFFIVYN